MFMMYTPTEFHVSRDSDSLVTAIKQKPVEHCHKMATLLLHFTKTVP
jgi:hypothetical protein